MTLEIKHLQTSCGDPKVVFEHSGNYMIDGDEFSRLRSENAELKQKLRDHCTTCPVSDNEDECEFTVAINFCPMCGRNLTEAK